MGKRIYVWGPDLIAPSNKTETHCVELLRGKVTAKDPLDKGWIAYEPVKKPKRRKP